MDPQTPIPTQQNPQPAQIAPAQPATSLAPQTIAQQPATNENIYTEICAQIIKELSRIIGANLALEQANNVEGLKVDPVTYHCQIEGNGSMVINELIERYRDFFGHAAVEVCREAAARFLAGLPSDETPSLLKP